MQPGSTGPWHGGPVTPRTTAVVAGNPSIMTLDGTNSWLIHEPGSTGAVLVDPGPDEPDHQASLLTAARLRGARIELILLTHGHPDHAAGADRLHDITGAPVAAVDPAHRRAFDAPVDGDTVEVGGLQLVLRRTPGHTADSLTVVLPADGALLTGDTVLGQGTSVIAHPDGDLSQYLDSLDMLAEVARASRARWILPGHGPARPHPLQLIKGYRTHRLERLSLVSAALARGMTGEQLLDAAYPGLPAALRPAARLSLAAQVTHLTGRAEPVPGVWGGLT